MQSTEILRAEHDAVLVVLDQLKAAVAAAECGVPVPKDIFTDIEEFFTVFVERCHHGKEEASVFHQLESGAAGEQLAKQLSEEHATGKQLAGAYADAVAAYLPGDIESARRLAEATRSYDVMLRQHIDEENTELFPAMEEHLAAADARIVEEFDRREIEEIGEGTHERLHGMIDSLPARIEPWTTANIADA